MRYQVNARIAWGISRPFPEKSAELARPTDRETEAVARWMMDALVDAAMREGRTDSGARSDGLAIAVLDCRKRFNRAFRIPSQGFWKP